MKIMFPEKNQGVLNIEQSYAKVAVNFLFDLGVIEFFKEALEFGPFFIPIGFEFPDA